MKFLKNLFLYIFFFIFLAACGAEDSDIAALLDIDLESIEDLQHPERSSAKLDPKSLSSQKITAKNSSEIAGTFVVFGAGSLAIDEEDLVVSLEVGSSSLATDVSLELFTEDEIISEELGTTVIVHPNREVSLNSAFSIAVPVPQASLSLVDESLKKLVVFYKVYDFSKNKFLVGLKTEKSLSLSADKNFVILQSKFFGSFQALRLKEALSAEVEKESTATSIKNKKGASIFSKKTQSLEKEEKKEEKTIVTVSFEIDKSFYSELRSSFEPTKENKTTFSGSCSLEGKYLEVFWDGDFFAKALCQNNKWSFDVEQETYRGKTLEFKLSLSAEGLEAKTKTFKVTFPQTEAEPEPEPEPTYKSCLAIKTANANANSAQYKLLAESLGSEEKQVFCEMDKEYNSQAGGWTLLMGSFAESSSLNSTTFKYSQGWWQSDDTNLNPNLFPPTQLVSKKEDETWTEWKAHYDLQNSWESKYDTYNKLAINQLMLRIYLNKADCSSDTYDCYGDLVFDISQGLPGLINNQTNMHADSNKSPHPAAWFFSTASEVTHTSYSGSTKYAVYRNGSIALGENISSLNNNFFTAQQKFGICGLNLKINVFGTNRYHRLGCVWNNESSWSSNTKDQYWGIGSNSYSANSKTRWCNHSLCSNKSLRQSSSKSNRKLNFLLFGRCQGDACSEHN